MSPAGYWPQVHAAIEAGADAIYFGLKHFTARAKVGFAPEELPALMQALHRRGVRGFLTFNTLVFDEEITEAARALELIASSGVDAIIVQDPAVLKLARAIAPELEIHASTQMSVTDAHGARLAAQMGVQRVTLARELSLDEIRSIRQNTGVELEVFVHGALCVAYSGQCFSSEAWGGRSANRGQCAQACRMPYEMYVDGEHRPLGDARYLLSPGDLYALHQIPQLIDAGVSALKIEGRYKEADYVAATTRAYRQAVDQAWNGQALAFTPAQELDLEQVYSRGLGPFFLTGTNHQAVVNGRAPRHRGVLMGKVLHINGKALIVETTEAHRISPLKPGDGVVLDASDWRSPQEPEEGGRVYEISPRGSNKIEVRFGNDAIRFDRVRAGDWLWRSNYPELDRKLKPLLETATPLHTRPVHVSASAHEGKPLRLTWTVAGRRTAGIVVESPEPLARSQNRPLTAEFLRQQLERLGNTAYHLGQLDADIEGQPFVPASLLNQLRRDAVEKLTVLEGQPPTRIVHPAASAVPPLLQAVSSVPNSLSNPRLHLLVRSADQLDSAIALRPASLTLDYLDLYGLKPSVERVRESGIAVRVASPRILKPGEEKITDFLLRLDCELLIRPTGLLDAIRGRTHQPITGDFSLNAANAVTASWLLEMGLTRITPTHDLNAAQVTRLAQQIGGSRLEAIVYQHLPVFHMEHCVFCRFLSTGTSYKDCGRPCEEHRLELRDVSGRSHPVMADVGCRNTVFGAEAQEASLHMSSWLAAGMRDFRLEFVHESPAQITRITTAWRDALEGRSTWDQLTESVRRLAPQGSTQGSLFVIV